MSRRWQIVLVSFSLLLLAGGGYLLWWLQPRVVMDEARSALTGSPDVRVNESKEHYAFEPSGDSFDLGVIFYPGGLVPVEAYAPLALSLAEIGYPVWLVKMPLHLAILGADRARDVQIANPYVEKWILMGHSLGGAMAARYVYENSRDVDGLVLLAGYPAANQSLHDSSVPVLSISASNDGLATPATIQGTADRLPPSTIFLEIQGGNHSQFGWYGFQDRDLPAGISRMEQQNQIVTAIAFFAQSITENR